MNSEPYAKLFDRYICRFGELTKREIQVFCYLLKCRNGHSLKCNPARATIAAGTGIDRPNAGRAVAGLIAKGWIEDDGAGNFGIADEPGELLPNWQPETRPEVAKLATAEVAKMATADAAARLPNWQSPVAELAIQSCQIGNRYIKDSFKNELTTKGTDKARAVEAKPETKPKPKTKTKTDRKKKPIPIRIPSDFALSDEMAKWYLANVPELRSTPETATEDFIEYWTNRSDKKSFAVDWVLRWKKGMRLLLQWQVRDDAARAIGEIPFRGNAGDAVPVSACSQCFGSGRVPAPAGPKSIPRGADKWQRFLTAVGDRVVPVVFDTWFARIDFVGVNTAGNPIAECVEMTKDWIEGYYRETIAEALPIAGFGGDEIEFRIYNPEKNSIDCPECSAVNGKQKVGT